MLCFIALNLLFISSMICHHSTLLYLLEHAGTMEIRLYYYYFMNRVVIIHSKNAVSWAESRVTTLMSPSNTVTFGKVTAYQQAHKDTPEWIKDYCTLVMHVLCVPSVLAPQSSTCSSSASVRRQVEHSGLSTSSSKLHKMCVATKSRLP